MEFGLHSQPPASNLFSLFQDAVAYRCESNEPNNGFSIYIRMVYVFIYIHLYIQETHGVWVVFAASRLESVFALSRCGRVSRCAKRPKQWL